MQLFILTIINIAMAIVFYLIISLKLEKSSSIYREKKMHSEMDDIIREFNSSAERNISILENKIRIMRKLLEKNGDMKSIDITVGDDKTVFKKSNVSNNDILIKEENPVKIDETERYSSVDNNEKKGLIILLEKVKLKLLFFMDMLKKRDIKESNPIIMENHSSSIKTESLIEKDFSVIDKKDIYNKNSNKLDVESKIQQRERDNREEKSFLDKVNENIGLLKQEEEIVVREDSSPDDKELEKMFHDSDDKYSLIFELNQKGYPMETLSKYSGVPVGEIKLVLNLNNS